MSARLIGPTAYRPEPGLRVEMRVAPSARSSLHALLFEPEMRGVGWSEFILRAVSAARDELEAQRAEDVEVA